VCLHLQQGDPYLPGLVRRRTRGGKGKGGEEKKTSATYPIGTGLPMKLRHDAKEGEGGEKRYHLQPEP